MASRSDIAALRSLLDRVLSQAPSKPKTRRRRRANAAPPQQPLQAAAKPRRRRRRGANATAPVVGAEGTVRVRRTEFVKKVQTPSGGDTVEDKVILAPSNLTWLKGVANAFDRVVWHSCRVEYRPYTSVTTSGSIALGIDWNFGSANKRENVLACTPNSYGTVYTKLAMTLPAQQLQSRRFYTLNATGSDLSPGQLLFSATAPAGTYCGDIFIHYDVSLHGTSNA